MVGMFCKSCFGAKLVSYPVCYRALFVQVKSVRALVYFWVLSEQRVFVVFHTLFLVIYIHAAPFRFIRSWAGEETKSYVGLWSGFFRGWQRQIELGVVYELYYGVEICFLLPTYHIICWAYENTMVKCEWSFVLRSQLANLSADCRFEHKHKLFVKSELFLFSTLAKHGIESSKLVNTPSVQQSVKKQTCSLAFTFVHVLTPQVVCCYAPLLFPRFD